MGSRLGHGQEQRSAHARGRDSGEQPPPDREALRPSVRTFRPPRKGRKIAAVGRTRRSSNGHGDPPKSSVMWTPLFVTDTGRRQSRASNPVDFTMGKISCQQIRKDGVLEIPVGNVPKMPGI